MRRPIKGENDEWSHLLGINYEMVTMTAKKGKFEFDDKMKDGAKKAGHDIKEGGGDLIDGVKKAGHDLKDDIVEAGSKMKKKLNK